MELEAKRFVWALSGVTPNDGRFDEHRNHWT
jgi:hypothetical protein